MSSNPWGWSPSPSPQPTSDPFAQSGYSDPTVDALAESILKAYEAFHRDSSAWGNAFHTDNDTLSTFESPLLVNPTNPASAIPSNPYLQAALRSHNNPQVDLSQTQVFPPVHSPYEQPPTDFEQILGGGEYEEPVEEVKKKWYKRPWVWVCIVCSVLIVGFTIWFFFPAGPESNRPDSTPSAGATADPTYPPVVGLSLTNALDVLKAEGYNNVTAFDEAGKPVTGDGYVVTSIETKDGNPVLTVAKGYTDADRTVTIPEITGKSSQEANSLLQAAGSVNVQWVNEDGSEASPSDGTVVVKVTPVQGTKVAPKEPITVTVKVKDSSEAAPTEDSLLDKAKNLIGGGDKESTSEPELTEAIAAQACQSHGQASISGFTVTDYSSKKIGSSFTLTVKGTSSDGEVQAICTVKGTGSNPEVALFQRVK